MKNKIKSLFLDKEKLILEFLNKEKSIEYYKKLNEINNKIINILN